MNVHTFSARRASGRRRRGAERGRFTVATSGVTRRASLLKFGTSARRGPGDDSSPASSRPASVRPSSYSDHPALFFPFASRASRGEGEPLPPRDGRIDSPVHPRLVAHEGILGSTSTGTAAAPPPDPLSISPPPALLRRPSPLRRCRRSPREYSSRRDHGRSVRDSSLLRRLPRTRAS